MRNDVAALYVDPRGPYPQLVRDWYDEARDARRYAGPLPVVAHPPCGPWGKLRHLSKNDDPDLAVRAVTQVRLCGGVLEHPAGSMLFDAAGLPRPGGGDDAWGGYSLEVCQVDWGHPARKRTWLYIVGTSWHPPMPPAREPTHWVSGGRNPERKDGARGGGIVPKGIKVCSAKQRRTTPTAFATWLIEIAGTAKVPDGRSA